MNCPVSMGNQLVMLCHMSFISIVHIITEEYELRNFYQKIISDHKTTRLSASYDRWHEIRVLWSSLYSMHTIRIHICVYFAYMICDLAFAHCFILEMLKKIRQSPQPLFFYSLSPLICKCMLNWAYWHFFLIMYHLTKWHRKECTSSLKCNEQFAYATSLMDLGTQFKVHG